MKSPVMRHNLMPRAVLATAAVIFLGGAAACGENNEKDAQTTHDKATKCLDNSLDGKTATSDLPVPGEHFKLRASYSTDYKVDAWKITDTKALDIKFEVVPDEPGQKLPQILVENMHADATIKAHKEAVNGMPADSMDDHIHAGSQPGFEIDERHPYNERFVISGFSQTLTSAWGSFINGYGSWEEEEKRLTEKNLIRNKAYAEEIDMVVDLLMRDQVEPGSYFHKAVVQDSLMVPLAGVPCQPAK